MRRFTLIFIMLFCSTSWALRDVEFEWEEIEGARRYQIELKNKKSLSKTFESNTNNFKIRIAPGKYQIRGKVHGVDPADTQSDWSPWKEFDIPPAKVEAPKLEKTEFKISSNSYLSSIPLNWKPVEGATEYILEITEANGKIKKTLHTSKPEALLQLRPGYYSVRMISKTADGLESDPLTLPTLTIQNIPVEPPKNIRLDADKSTLQYEPAQGTSIIIALERQAFLGKEWNPVDKKVTTEGTYVWSSGLFPGKYRITLYSKNSFNEVSKPYVKEFIVKPKEQDLPPQ